MTNLTLASLQQKVWTDEQRRILIRALEALRRTLDRRIKVITNPSPKNQRLINLTRDFNTVNELIATLQQ